jgi:hypothetical protein
MFAGLGFDQLHVHAKPLATALHRAFERVADVQLSPDLLHIDGLAFVGERGIAGDHK